MPSVRKLLVPSLLVMVCSILFPGRLLACYIQDSDSAYQSDVNLSLNGYARILEDADSNDRTCVDLARATLTNKVNNTPVTVWKDWLQGANAAFAYAAALRIGANGFADVALDQALERIKANLEVGRELDSNNQIACAQVSGDQCMDDFAVASPGFAWLAAYESKRSRPTATYQQTAIDAINSAFGVVCIQDPTKPLTPSPCNGAVADLEDSNGNAGTAYTLSFNHGQQMPSYGFGLMTSIASAAIGLKASGSWFYFPPDQQKIARALAREMQAHVSSGAYTNDCHATFDPAEVGTRFCGGPGPDLYQASMYELKEFYDIWLGGMPAGSYQASLSSFNGGDFNTFFFSDGRYVAYYTQSYDWLVNPRELMPIDLVDPIGYLDSISSSGLASGWTCDQDAPTHSNRVDIYSNGTLAGSAYATLQSEAAVNSWCGGGTAHRYLAQLAPWARGTTLIAYGIDYTYYGSTQLTCGNCSWIDNPPVASFTVSSAGRAITTDASGSTDDVGITSYQWNWGDGQTGSGAGANHGYANNGTFTIGLTVTDTAGHQNSTSQNVTLIDNPPVARFTISCPSLSCSTDGSFSSDDGGITLYQWNWGDGQTTNGGPYSSHTYLAGGAYVVTLTVTDTVGQTNATTHAVGPCAAAGISAQPTSNPSSIPVGGTSALTIAVTGSAPVTVVWSTIAGSNVGTGTSINVSPAITTQYYATVSNSCGSTQSANVTVTICSPVLGTNPTATPSTITSGQVSRLENSGATGPGPLTYLWYKSDGTLVGSTTSKKFNVTPSVTTSYYYKVSNSCGPTTGPSPTVTVTVQ